LAAVGWPLIAILVVIASLVPLALGQPVLAMAPGILLLGIVILAFKPRWLLYGIVFLIPLGGIRELGGPLEGLQFHWVLAGGLLVAFAGYVLSNRSIAERLRCNLWPIYLIFLALALFASLFSPYRAEAINQAILVVVGMLYVAMAIVFLDRQAIRQVLPRVIIAGVTLGSLTAVLDYYFGIRILGDPQLAGRGVGLTVDPNSLAMQVLFVVPFLAYQLAAGRSLGAKVFTLILVAINLAAMVTTMSRSGALVLGLIAVALVLANPARFAPRKLGLVFLGLLVSVVSIAVSVPDTYWERQETLISGERDNAMNRRIAYVRVSARYFLTSPVIGHGLGSFKFIFSQTEEAVKYERGEKRDRVRDAHNTYLEVLIGSGVLGFAAFIGLIGLSFLNLHRAFKILRRYGDREGADLALHYMMAFAALMLFLSFFSDIHQKFMLLMLAVSVLWLRDARAIESADLAIAEQRPPASPSRPLPRRRR
jgi:O-antigen ligase